MEQETANKNNDLKHNISFLIFAIFMMCVGAFAVYLGIHATLSQQVKDTYYLYTEGTLTDIIRTDSITDEDVSYEGVYEYTVDGETYVAKWGILHPSSSDIGGTVTVRYDPENPYDAYKDGMSEHSGFTVVGAMFILLPLFIIFSFINFKGKARSIPSLVGGTVALLIGFGALYLIGWETGAVCIMLVIVGCIGVLAFINGVRWLIAG